MKPISEHPEYRELTEQINDLSVAKGKVGSRLAELEAQLRAGTPDAGDTHVNAALEFAKTGNVVVPSNVTAELREAHVILRLRISAIVDACFRLIVDGVSAPSWTRRGCAQARG